mmetsp:Transcript_67097/g.188991  ORF Transcript_67097/g.188991 Transcript_67097/m.188991 type:complete len:359 (+) Transcript_67097:234-1310(+)
MPRRPRLGHLRVAGELHPGAGLLPAQELRRVQRPRPPVPRRLQGAAGVRGARGGAGEHVHVRAPPRPPVAEPAAPGLRVPMAAGEEGGALGGLAAGGLHLVPAGPPGVRVRRGGRAGAVRRGPAAAALQPRGRRLVLGRLLAAAPAHVADGLPDCSEASPGQPLLLRPAVPVCVHGAGGARARVAGGVQGLAAGRPRRQRARRGLQDTEPEPHAQFRGPPRGDGRPPERRGLRRRGRPRGEAPGAAALARVPLRPGPPRHLQRRLRPRAGRDLPVREGVLLRGVRGLLGQVRLRRQDRRRLPPQPPRHAPGGCPGRGERAGVVGHVPAPSEAPLPQWRAVRQHLRQCRPAVYFCHLQR